MRVIALILVCLTLAAGAAAAQTLEDLMARLPDGGFGERAEVVGAIAATGDPRAAALLEALGEGELHARKADGAIVRVTGRGSKAQGFDAADRRRARAGAGALDRGGPGQQRAAPRGPRRARRR